MMEDYFEILRSKEIIQILDGDVNFGYHQFNDDTSFKISMPYLSGPRICEISSHFGHPIIYPSKGADSRWIYFDKLLNYCINNKKTSALLSYLFNINRFSSSLQHLSHNNISIAHEIILTQVKEKINDILLFSNKELVYRNNTYFIRNTIFEICPEFSELKEIDQEYIKNIVQRANNDIDVGNFDSAITKARTLLEETFIYVIEKHNILPSKNGDIKRLYKQTQELCNMHTGREIDRCINTLLSGLNNIVTGIAEMRNIEGDAHGAGNKRMGVSDYHARLCLNAATTVADFILSMSKTM